MERVPFKKIKDSVLGTSYDLSIAIITPAAMRQAMKYKKLSSKETRSMTLKTKKRDYVSNVLSFPLSKTSGEILLCRSAAKPYTMGYLFIHGVLHLKGLKHSATMDSAERRLLARFNICKKSLPASTSAPTKSR